MRWASDAKSQIVATTAQGIRGVHDERRQFLLAVHHIAWALRNNRAVSRPLKNMKPIPIGTRGSYAKTVAPADLASHLDASLAAVMSTPTMVAMMELAALDAVRPFLDAGESSVGMSIEVNHSAATPPGHRARTEAEVTKVEGRRLEFSVLAFDEVEQVGSGTHRRAVIDAAKFNDRIRTKQKKD